MTSRARSPARRALKGSEEAPEREAGGRPRAPSMILALLLTAVGAAAQTPAPEAAPTRVETFVIERDETPGAGSDPWSLLAGDVAPSQEPAGYLLWRRSEGEDGATLEWDVRFLERDTRVLEIERPAAAGAALVYRELRPQSGRTLSAEWVEQGSALRLREWGGPEGLQLRLDDCDGGRFRLGLLEDLRAAAAPPRAARVFDPLGRRFEHLAVEVEHGPADGPRSGARIVRLTREDGSSAGAWLLRGEEVLGFQWQAGGLRARRIDAQEYDRRMAEIERRRASEDAAPATPPARGAE